MSQRSLTKSEQDFDLLSSRGLPPKVLESARRGRQPSDWFESAREEVESLAELGPNWDSYGADAPWRELLVSGLNMLRCLSESGHVSKPHICLTSAGGMQFEWENDDRYFEIEIVGNFAATYTYSDPAERFMKSGEVFVEEPLDFLIDYVRKVERMPT